MSDPIHQNTVTPQQSILGYTLKERIGAGGYGEVWSAEAPGGLEKAVKLVFGYHDDNRAQRELKALDRVKQVRHPFLLSLERIDVVDGRLVVISELADMSLKDRFNECREEGIEGIEREELLQYMRESADALDYLAETFSLAHLDIKPENLLIVGNHIKVADFGLVKDFQSVEQSLMDGLTPAYAAPELFDGKPGRFSDQYSLAIVYQEMLTGTRPFSGTTTAQLATQQLHGRPNLNSLPRGDQAVVARALAKNFEQRYPCCRDMVDELCRRRGRVKHSQGPAKKLDPVNTSQVTDATFAVSPKSNNQSQGADATMVVSESFLPAAKYEAELEKQKPLPLDKKAVARPTLFVGVGQTATTALRKLRAKLSAQFGPAENLPAFRILCLDTDRRLLLDETLGDADQTLQGHETLPIPLRKPDEYRQDSDLELSWIGRRWIYNIPKSQQTEGLRPLGRLAFVEHVDEITQRMRDEIEKASCAEALATTAETLGLEPGELEPQIIFVSSISGGLGSGMLLDLAYATRTTLTSLGLPDQRLYGLLTHATSRYERDPRVAIANTYSFLNEYYHYNLHGYPGAAYCQIPAFDDQNPAFDATYVVHLGDDLNPADYDVSADRIALYLYLGVASECNQFFDECRDVLEFDPNLVRTFGINSLSCGRSAFSERPAQIISSHLVDRWLTGAGADSFDPEKYVESIRTKTGFTEIVIDQMFDEFFQEHLGADPVIELMQSINTKFQSESGEAKRHILATSQQVLNEKLGIPDQTDDELALCRMLESSVKNWGLRCYTQMEKSFLALIDDPGARIFGAFKSLEAFEQHLHTCTINMEARTERLNESQAGCYQRVEAIQNPNPKSEEPTESIVDVIRDYVEASLALMSVHYQRVLLRDIARRMVQLNELVHQFREQLEMLHRQIQLIESTMDTTTDVKGEKDLVSLIEQQVVGQSDSVLGLMEKNLQQNFLAAEGGLLQIMKSGTNAVRHLPVAIRREANLLTCKLLEQVRIDSLLREYNFSAAEIASWLSELVEKARPDLMSCGGGSRLMLAVPKQAPVTSIAGFIENQYDHEANVIPSTCGDLVVCYEMENMPVENIAMRLLQLQPTCVDLIRRLHVRNDIEWTSLTPMC